jgi:hypothetical protein
MGSVVSLIEGRGHDGCGGVIHPRRHHTTDCQKLDSFRPHPAGGLVKRRHFGRRAWSAENGSVVPTSRATSTDGRYTLAMSDALFSPAAARNAGPIVEVVKRVLPLGGLVLEIASGSGVEVANRSSVSGHLPDVRSPLQTEVTQRPFGARFGETPTAVYTPDMDREKAVRFSA